MGFKLCVTLLLLFALESDALCYLTGDDCPVCFQSPPGGERIMSKCPDTIDISFEKEPPMVMYAGMDYPSTMKFTVNFGNHSVKQEPTHIPHINFHSCISKEGACTPFVKNTPGLATHTKAKKGNFTIDENNIGTALSDQVITLSAEIYTIIAHGRFFVGTTQWDVSYGIHRTVIEQKVKREVSLDAVLSLAVLAVLVLVGIGAVQYSIYQNKCSMDAVFMAMSNETLGLLFRFAMNVADVATFTLAFVTIIAVDEDYVEVVPFSVLCLIVGWPTTLYAAVVYVKQIVNIYDTADTVRKECIKAGIAGCKKVFAREKEGDVKKKRVGLGKRSTFVMPASGLERQLSSQDVFQSNMELLFDDMIYGPMLKKRWALKRVLDNRAMDFVTMFLESFPLLAASFWCTMLAADSNATNAAALATAALCTGAKFVGAKGYKQVRDEMSIIDAILYMGVKQGLGSPEAKLKKMNDKYKQETENPN